MNGLTFPAARDALHLALPSFEVANLALRAATVEDLPYLRTLYAASRAQELAVVPWPDEVRRIFCDSQFDLQHRHYTAHYRPADFLIVLHDGQPVGRLYLHATPKALHIVDVLLQESVRGQGLGSSLLRALQGAVREQDLGELSLHVELRNAQAQRLYQRLGFTAGVAKDTHRTMAWRP